MIPQFDHRHSGHCESGALSALLRNRGLDLSEPMIFGIGGGLFFIHLAWVKMGGIPLTAYRGAPRTIIKSVCKRLGIKMHQHRFRSQEAGMQELDRFLERGIPVGLQTCVFWLPYFPPDMRFQFNAHNLVAFGKHDGDYYLSDPVFEDVVTCGPDDLKRARFAKGMFAPKGLIYYPEQVPSNPDLSPAIRDAIRHTSKQMIGTPMPFLGVRGIRSLAKQMERWPHKLGASRARSYVSSVVRMQEEIGTGGAGFRFMYAAFLQEAGALLGESAFTEASEMMTATGDRWREFAVAGAKLCKGGAGDASAYAELAHIVRDCADREEKIFRLLAAASKRP